MNFFKKIFSNEGEDGNQSKKDESKLPLHLYKNGDKYIGDKKNGARNGTGTYIFSNGDRYEGQWKNNQKHGKGNYYYKSGELYIGCWENNKRKGLGKYFYMNGERYVGYWDEDKKHGTGTQFYPDRQWYRGEYFKGNKHGKGQFHEVNAVYQEEWENGVFISRKKIKDVNQETHEKQGEEEEVRVEKQVQQYEEEEKKRNDQVTSSTNKKENNEVKENKNINNKNENDYDVPNQEAAVDKNLQIQTYNTDIYNSENSQQQKQRTSMQSQASNQDFKEKSMDKPQHWDTIMRSLYHKNESLPHDSINIMESQYHSATSDMIENLTAIELITHESLMKKLVTKWTKEEVCLHLEYIGLSQFKDVFLQNDMTGLVLYSLTELNLKTDMGMNLGQVKVFTNSLKCLRRIQKKNMTEQDIQNYQNFKKAIEGTTKNSKVSSTGKLDSVGLTVGMNLIEEESSFSEKEDNPKEEKQTQQQQQFLEDLKDKLVKTNSKSCRKSISEYSQSSDKGSSDADIDDDEERITINESASPKQNGSMNFPEKDIDKKLTKTKSSDIKERSRSRCVISPNSNSGSPTENGNGKPIMFTSQRIDQENDDEEEVGRKYPKLAQASEQILILTNKVTGQKSTQPIKVDYEKLQSCSPRSNSSITFKNNDDGEDSIIEGKMRNIPSLSHIQRHVSSRKHSQNQGTSPKTQYSKSISMIVNKQRSKTKILSEKQLPSNQNGSNEAKNYTNNITHTNSSQENKQSNTNNNYSMQPEMSSPQQHPQHHDRQNYLLRKQSTEVNKFKEVFAEQSSDNNSNQGGTSKQKKWKKVYKPLNQDKIITPPKEYESSTSSDESSSTSSEEEKTEFQELKQNQLKKAQSAATDMKIGVNSPLQAKNHSQKERSKRTNKKKIQNLTDQEILEKIQQFMDREKLSNFLIDSKELIWSSDNRIGAGGYGEVYKGSWLGQDVAVKQYGKKRTRFNKKRAFDFISEVQVINGLRHPNIVLYMGVCITPSYYLLINEYLEQGSLFDHLHIKQSQIDEEKLIYIVEDIALGMTYLHGRGVLHCDLKTPNVLVDQNWNVKLCDFGLSRIRTNLSKKKKGKSGKIGTIQWMAPEIMRELEYTEKSDVYSFGMILWELLTRKIPFQHMSYVQILGTVAHDDNYRQDIPQKGHQQLLKILKSCLQRKPEERPDFKEIVTQIQKISKQEKKGHRKVIKDLVMFFGN